MDFGQFIRQFGRSLRASLSAFLALLKRTARAATARAADFADTRGHGLSYVLALPGVWRGVVLLLMALVIIYPLAAWWLSVIDDNPDFGVAPNTLQVGQSFAVANAAALLDREVNDHGWTPNDTWLWPTALLDNMPNYQRGIVAALAHFSAALNDPIGHAHGADPDEDLQEAVSDLQYSPDAWSFWPLSTSEHHYNAGIEALNHYNGRLPAGAATFGRRAEDLRAALARIGVDLSAAGETIDTHLQNETGFFINNKADDVFYVVKGRMYAYYIVLKGLQRDYASVIKSRNLGGNWQHMMGAFHDGIGLRPWVVLNGAPDSQFVPCPLCAEGFYLLRARADMQAVADGLAK